MEYLLTFENGSSAFLAHHGVKGMHWGVWNEETRAKRMAKDLKRQFRKAPHESMSYKHNKYAKEIYNDPDVKAAHDRYVKSRSEETRYFNDPKLMKKYKIKAADKAHKTYGENPNDKEEREDFRFGYEYGDFDQGLNNSFTLYLNDRIKSGKVNASKYFKEQNDAWNEYNDSLSKASSRLLGKYKDIPVRGSHGYAKRTVGSILEFSARSAYDEKEAEAKLFGDYSPYDDAVPLKKRS